MFEWRSDNFIYSKRFVVKINFQNLSLSYRNDALYSNDDDDDHRGAQKCWRGAQQWRIQIVYIIFNVMNRLKILAIHWQQEKSHRFNENVYSFFMWYYKQVVCALAQWIPFITARLAYFHIWAEASTHNNVLADPLLQLSCDKCLSSPFYFVSSFFLH